MQSQVIKERCRGAHVEVEVLVLVVVQRWCRGGAEVHILRLRC